MKFGMSIILLAFLTTATSVPSTPPTRIEEYARKYQGIKSEYERVLFCVEVIDEGLIHRLCSVQVVDQIFGTNYANWLPDKRQRWQDVVVDFHDPTHDPSRPGPDLFEQAGTGWYFAFKFDDRGIVHDYCISNVGKGK